jgi:hypothetical protein
MTPNILLCTAADGKVENSVISILEHTEFLPQLLEKFEQFKMLEKSATIRKIRTVQEGEKRQASWKPNHS